MKPLKDSILLVHIHTSDSNSLTEETLCCIKLMAIIRLSTAHAKLKLRRQVLKSSVEAALQVLHVAIYHQELTEMEEYEQEKEKKLGKNCSTDHDARINASSHK
ncbi:hypothetical protein BC332_19734 [Capsicum chinense]|nr:hypothetical protein BC332_19734 [Capsicum chinense]